MNPKNVLKQFLGFVLTPLFFNILKMNLFEQFDLLSLMIELTKVFIKYVHSLGSLFEENLISHLMIRAKYVE